MPFFRSLLTVSKKLTKLWKINQNRSDFIENTKPYSTVKEKRTRLSWNNVYRTKQNSQDRCAAYFSAFERMQYTSTVDLKFQEKFWSFLEGIFHSMLLIYVKSYLAISRLKVMINAVFIWMILL